MFTDETLDSIEFKSAWRKDRSLAERSSQTRELAVYEVACQSVDRVEIEIQTEDEPEKEIRLGEDNSRALVDFLQKVEPYISKQLQRNSRSHAFDGYDVNWEEETLAVTNVHTLSHGGQEQQMEVTSIAWNSTGSVLAAAYGRHDHEDWCTHKSSLCTWNVDRRSVDANKPDTVVDLPSCLMCVSWHPKQPAWVAGGTFDGEVIVWDCSRDTSDLVIASSGIGDDSHREPVSKVQWVLDPDSKGKRYHVVSVSSDGKILVWKLNTDKQTLKLVDGFILMTESLPRSLMSKSKRGDQEMGVTCISYSHIDNSVFVIGSESGGIFKCSTHTKGSPAGSHIVSSVPLRSPVTFTFSPHVGPVYAVECSPYHRNLFLSSGTDTTARLYSMLQAAPVVTLEPGEGYLYSAKWSAVRPLVFAVATESGHLLIYDLKRSYASPIHKLEASPKKLPVYSMQFNHKQTQLLATGDQSGCIKVWRLSDGLTSQDPNESELLEEIANSTTE